MRFQIHWNEATLRATRDVAPRVRLFEIAPIGGTLPWTPGSHLEFSLVIGGQPALRAYSLVGEPDAHVYRVAVKLPERSRGGAAYMWSLTAGARLRVSEPHNHFELTPGRPEYLLIAGGIGITPVYGMALALARANAKFRLLYAGRTRDDLPFASELREALGERLSLFVSDEQTRLDLAAAIDTLSPDGELYLCGPMRLLDAARAIWRERKRPMSRFRFETFGSSGCFAPAPFRVCVPRLGVDVAVREDQTMLEALEAAGVQVLADCRRGECGLCAMHILETRGQVDHRDVFLSDAEKTENHKICACVSRVASGSIVVDSDDRDD